MKKIKLIFVLFLFILNFFSLKNVFQKSYRELRSSNASIYKYKWWDLVEIEKLTEQCKGEIFKNSSFLNVSCKDEKIGEWLIEQKGLENIQYLSIIPAQTLFYNLEDFDHNKLKYLTITWNDFSNRTKANKKLNLILDSIQKDCKGINRVVLILFPTSKATIKGSMQNFKAKNEIFFSQKIIESKIKNIENKCINKKILKDDNDKHLVYWVEFRTNEKFK